MSNENLFEGVDPVAAIREMAHLSIINNKLNEIQVNNLKMYALIFFNGVNSAKIKYNLTTKHDLEVEKDEKNLDIKYNLKKPETKNFKVAYYLDIDEKQDNSNMDKRTAALKQAVSDLLWKDMILEVHFNDRMVYTSKENVRKQRKSKSSNRK